MAVYEWKALFLPLPFVSGQQGIGLTRMVMLVFCPYHSYPGSKAPVPYGW